MTRRRLTMLLPLTAALVAGGCSTFSDEDAIARVGDVEMKQEQVDEILPLVADPSLPAEAQAGATRTAISVWLEAQVFTQAVAESGIELDQAALDENTAQLSLQFPDEFPAMSDEMRDLLTTYVTSLDEIPNLPRPDDADAASWFNGGTEVSGLACISHILVDTEAEADDIVDELAEADANGGDVEELALFTDLAAERSTDTGSGANGGFLSCDASENIAAQYVPTFADASLAAIPGEPTDPVESDFGFHVIRLQTYAESGELLEQFYESGYVQARIAIDDADIHVDSRYGTADGLNVVPLV